MQNAYETRDFYLTGYFLSKGLKLLSHKKAGSVTVFFIENAENISDLISDYYSMKDSCNALSFGQALRTLKSIIHSSSNSNLNGLYNNGNNNNM